MTCRKLNSVTFVRRINTMLTKNGDQHSHGSEDSSAKTD